MLNPETLWWYSTQLYRSKRGRKFAYLLTKLNYCINHVDLPPECIISHDVKLFHRGIGVVVNPQVTIGSGVRIVHGVTIGVVSGSDGVAAGRVVIGNDVRIGAGATILAGSGKTLRIGSGAQIGAMAYVREDVPENSVVYAPLSQIRSRS